MNTATRELMFSSAKAEWATPQDFYDQLDAEFEFTLDAAADSTNHKGYYWYGPDHPLASYRDAFTRPWEGRVWCNPPYGRGIGAWVRKGYEESLGGATVVMLLPARTDTRWFHDYCVKGDIRFIKGRLKFGGADAAPFPSMVVIFKCMSASPYQWVRL